MISVLKTLLLCYLATLALESIPALCLPQGKAWWKVSLLCNTVTNPLLNVLLMMGRVLIPDPVAVALLLLLLEAGAVLAEAYIYKDFLKKAYRPCLLFSVIANVFSFTAGSLLLRAVL